MKGPVEECCNVLNFKAIFMFFYPHFPFSGFSFIREGKCVFPIFISTILRTGESQAKCVGEVCFLSLFAFDGFVNTDLVSESPRRRIFENVKILKILVVKMGKAFPAQQLFSRGQQNTFRSMSLLSHLNTHNLEYPYFV